MVHNYEIKEKFWTVGDKIKIRDGNTGEEMYNIKGKTFSVIDDLSLKDACENEIYHIEQELKSIEPTYKILKKNADTGESRVVAILKKDRTFQPKFFLHSMDKRQHKFDYHIEGNILDRELLFYKVVSEKHSTPAVWVSKKLLGFSRNSYKVRITDGEDDAYILAACIAIDKMISQ